jgi:hypothetical protein
MKRNGKVVFAPRDGMGAGKGDYPRNISEQFKQNYEKIDWTTGDDCSACGKILCICKKPE